APRRKGLVRRFNGSGDFFRRAARDFRHGFPGRGIVLDVLGPARDDALSIDVQGAGFQFDSGCARRHTNLTKYSLNFTPLQPAIAAEFANRPVFCRKYALPTRAGFCGSYFEMRSSRTDLRPKEQLVAGYTRVTPAFGLRVFMVDFNKLKTRK